MASPASLEAVTTLRTVVPMSAPVSDVAPGRGAGDVGTVGAEGVAALPLHVVVERRGAVPAADRGGQRLPVAVDSADAAGA